MWSSPASKVDEPRQQERIARMRLIWSDNVGPITFRHLLAKYGSGEAALDALPDLARKGGRKKPIQLCPLSVVEKEFEAIAAFGGEFIVLGDSQYPALLAATEDAPPVLAYKGHWHLTSKRLVAIVGARNASAVGRKLARSLSHELGNAGYIVASGLARGIDAAAHEGAIASGTVAVLGTGVDVSYPKENRDLHSRISAEGLLLSEHKMGTRPQASHFPRRNRIISGLSLGVIVVEAALRSGSLITARLALEQGREVMAMPGSPLDPRAKGANNLIRQGARLVEGVDDVLDALELLHRQPLKEPDRPLFQSAMDVADSAGLSVRDRDIILDKLNLIPVAIDDIIRDSGLTAAGVLTILLELELAGKIDRHPGNRVSLSSEHVGENLK
jgi:DNA processing protein